VSVEWPLQNVKAVFDAAIKVVIKPPQKQKEKRKPHRGCLLLVLSSFSLIYKILSPNSGSRLGLGLGYSVVSSYSHSLVAHHLPRGGCFASRINFKTMIDLSAYALFWNECRNVICGRNLMRES